MTIQRGKAETLEIKRVQRGGIGDTRERKGRDHRDQDGTEWGGLVTTQR